VSVFQRSLKPPGTTFFLLGRRGTGKSTWARSTLGETLTLDLSTREEALEYGLYPWLLRSKARDYPRRSWIVVDEVQRVPKLFDEIRFLMAERRRRFALIVSSTRKLHRAAAEIPTAPLITRTLRPLTCKEMGFSVPTEQLLRYGCLPLSVTAESDEARSVLLQAYLTSFLSDEIETEGLAKDLAGFSRFLRFAALAAGRTTSISSVSQDAEISRDTVRGYFDVLVDTLVAAWLPAYRAQAKVKEVARPKLYWFDSGVLQAAVGAFDQPMPSDWSGVLLAHLLFHELRAYLEASGVNGTLGHWATPTGSKVDFVWWRRQRLVAIDAHNGREHRRAHHKGITALLSGRTAKSYVVYLGDKELDVDGTLVLPFSSFVRRLYAGEVLR
jgi:uncharacterized protein